MTFASWEEVAAFALTLPMTVPSPSGGQPVRYDNTASDRIRTVVTRAWWDRATLATRRGHDPRP